MVKWLLGLGLALGFILLPQPAYAVPCVQTLVFVTGEVLTAAVLNANPANEVTCINNIDNTNIGANGVYASQVIPTNQAQATFGGAINYIFPNGVTSNGTGTFTSGTNYGNIAAAGLPFVFQAATGNTTIGASSGITLNGVTGSALAITSNGNGEVTVDQNGNLGVLNKVVSAVVYGNNASSALPYQYQSSGAGTGIGASSGFIVNGVTGNNLMVAQNGSSTGLAMDTSGNASFSGHVSGGSVNTCTATSGVPCSTTSSIAFSAANTGTATVTVPASSHCFAQHSNGYVLTAQVYDPQVALASTTLTITQDLGASVTGTINYVVACI